MMFLLDKTESQEHKKRQYSLLPGASKLWRGTSKMWKGASKRLSFSLRLNVSLVFILLLVLPGCELLGIAPSADRINKLFDQHRYREILDISNQQLEKPLASDAAVYWNGVREKGEVEVQAYRQQQLVELNEFVASQNWAAANPRVELLKRNLPLDNQLNEFFNEVEQKRQARIIAVQHQLNLMEAKNLTKIMTLYSSWLEVDPSDESAQKRLEYEQNRRDSLVSYFSNLSKQAEESNNVGLELRYLLKQIDLLSGLDSSHTEALLPKKERLESRIASWSKVRDETKAADALAKQNVKRLDAIAQYQQLVDGEEWIKAKQLIDELLVQSPEDPKLLRSKDDLQIQIRNEVGSGKLLAASFFSAGEIDKALRQWRAILPMAPDDEDLLQNIKRAEQIQAKVKHLKAER